MGYGEEGGGHRLVSAVTKAVVLCCVCSFLQSKAVIKEESYRFVWSQKPIPYLQTWMKDSMSV